MKTGKLFIGIGAAKSGTTWLSGYFSAHPEVCFSPIKELHFFDARHLYNCRIFNELSVKQFRNTAAALDPQAPDKRLLEQLELLLYRLRMIDDDQAYLDYFNSICRDGKIAGEITPSYAMLGPEGFTHMKKLVDGVRIIFLMRNPIERHWSHLRFMNKLQPDFDAGKRFRQSFDEDEFYQRSNYRNTLTALNSVFEDKDILYVFFEDLFSPDRGEDELRRICSFLDIGYLQAGVSGKVNVSDTVDLDHESRIFGINRLKSVYEYADEQFDRLPGEWYADMKYIK